MYEAAERGFRASMTCRKCRVAWAPLAIIALNGSSGGGAIVSARNNCGAGGVRGAHGIPSRPGEIIDNARRLSPNRVP